MKQEERTQRTRRKILEAAMETFGEGGYEGGTIGQIARRGINKGLIYHNFSGKDEVYLACVRKACGDLLAVVRADSPGSGSFAEENLVSYLQARARFSCEHPQESRVLFEALLMPPPRLEGEVRKALAPLREKNDALAREIFAEGETRPGVTEEQAIRYFSMIQEMYNAVFREGPLQDLPPEERIRAHEREIPQVLDLMLYGVLKQRTKEKKEEAEHA